MSSLEFSCRFCTRQRPPVEVCFRRVTYDGFAAVWPHYQGEFADKFNTMPKYIVSQTLTTPEWHNITVLSGDVVDEARKLKER